MRVLVIYESMYGNTHQIAEAIAEGFAMPDSVQVVPVAGVTREMVEQSDLIVVGGPTHAHGMSRERTRKAAVEAAEKPSKKLDLEPEASGGGVRDWLETLGSVHGLAAAFDTRVHGHVVLTGQASKGIAKALVDAGMDLITEPVSFLVDKHNHLLPGEHGRAFVWGEHLAGILRQVSTSH
jgi:hypothetical protein